MLYRLCNLSLLLHEIGKFIAIGAEDYNTSVYHLAVKVYGTNERTIVKVYLQQPTQNDTVSIQSPLSPPESFTAAWHRPGGIGTPVQVNGILILMDL
jgi:hypothetical protein